MIKDNSFLTSTGKKRLLFFLLADLFVFSFSVYLALLLRFDFNFAFISDKGYLNELFFVWIPVIIVLKVGLFYVNRLYFVSWRFVSVEEFFRISFSLSLALVVLVILSYVFFIVNGRYLIPRSVVIADFFISLVLTSGLRISKRFYLESIKRVKSDNYKKVLIVGAGSTGERIARELLNDEVNEFYPIGFVDDDENKLGIYIHNIKVFGKIGDMDKILSNMPIEAIIIAIPSLSYKQVRKIYETAKKHSINSVKIVPSVGKLPEKYINVKDLRDIKLEDLLARKPVEIDTQSVTAFLKEKVIFVTGAAGSIGSEIMMQLLKFDPSKIIAYEIDETEIFYLNNEINRMLNKIGKKIEIEYIVGDIKDTKKLRRIFESFDIDVVFHAAAYKHVPLMEFFPEEAVKTNVFGTYQLARLATEFEVNKFVNISTDKAVNPVNVMGATKRVAEIICGVFNKISDTSFVSVRFGNVLGSRGSVIPIFLEQIKNGGPVTVTHPDMKRYFMIIPEAVLLVFQAAAMGRGGEVFVLDMGEPVKIVDMAEELIKINGLEPYKDIDIVFSGIRPGEKLFEELLTAKEGTVSTKHKKIFVANTDNAVSKDKLENFLKNLQSLLEDFDSSTDFKHILLNFISGEKD